MDTLILMAGRGSRFSVLGLNLPKPLVPLHGQPLVRWVVENLRFNIDQRFIFVCLKQHIEEFKLEQLFSSWNIDFQIVSVDEVTDGAACSALFAKELYRHKPLLIANSDQFIIYDKNLFLKLITQGSGLIMSMNAKGPKWSYIKTDENDCVIEVKEKQPISQLGTTGVYYFNQGNLFEEAACKMIEANDRYNNEFYLAPTYNYLIKDGHRIHHFNVGETGKDMIGLGTAEDFKAFESSSVSLNIKSKIFP